MRSASGGLISLFAQYGPMVWADLYTITLQGGGTVLRYTSHDQSVPYGGNTFAVGPLITRGKTRVAVGIAVDTLDVMITGHDTDLVNGVPIAQFMARGGFDGARVRLERVFAADWATTPAGTILHFAGRVADIDMDRAEAKLIINSDTELLDVMVPKNVYKPGCNNTLYDDTCGISRAAKTVGGTVSSSAVSTRSVIRCNGGGGYATGYFDLGCMTFTSGPNAGISRTLKHYIGGTPDSLEVIAPFPFTPVAGDTCNVYPGCDKTQATCNSKFSNLIRFRGQPYIPVPETVT